MKIITENKQARFEYFVSKGAMDIDGFGDSIIERLIEKGYIENPSDIYKITYEQMKKWGYINLVHAYYEYHTK